MAVQIPTLDRIAPVEPASVGRIDYQGPNPAAEEAQQTQEAEHAVGTVERYVRVQQAMSADTTSTAAASQYHQFYENGLEGSPPGPNGEPGTVGTKQMGGDPAPIYQKLRQSADGQKQAIMSQYADASDMTKQLIAAKLAGVDRKFNDRIATAYSSQNTTYLNSVADQGAKQAKNDVVDATAHLDVYDPDTLVPVDAALNQTRLIRLQQGAKLGLATPVYDPSGKIDPATGTVAVIDYKDVAPSLAMKMAKDRSDALSNSISNLLAAGDVEGAKFITDQYKSSLDVVSRAKIETKTTKATQDAQALAAFTDVKDMPYAEGVKKLNEDIEDPKVLMKAMANLDTYRKRMEGATLDASKANYDAAARLIDQRKDSGRPFIDANDMHNDPAIKQLRDKITDPKHLSSLDHRVDPPKVSDPDVKNQFYDNLQNGKLKGMSASDFSTSIAGLSDSDRKMAESKWREFNVQSPAQQTTQVKNMAAQVEKEMQSAGLVKKNAYGQYNNKDQIILNKAKDDLIQQSDSFPANMSVKDQNSYVKNLVAEKVKAQVPQKGFFEGLADSAKNLFLPSPAKPANGAPPPAPSTSTVPGVQPTSSAVKAKTDAINKFQKANGRLPNDSLELQNFIKNGK